MSTPNRPEPLVSVVTPFYNTAAYLAECIESVLSQSYGNWEYVLVDNCSTDGSFEIAHAYAERDDRIRLTKASVFLPQVENYNRALSLIAQDSVFCKVVQADDFMFPECLSLMVAAAQRDADVALVSSYTYHEPLAAFGKTLPYIGNEGLPYDCDVLPGADVLRRYLRDRLAVFGSPTCVMFRSSDVRAAGEFYRIDSPNEDIEACFDVLLPGNAFAFVHQVLTFNRRQEGSIWWTIADWNADAMNKVILNRRYGPRLFAPETAAGLLQRARAVHYECLADGALSLRGRDYWRFHAEGLATVGLRIEAGRLALTLFLRILKGLVCPKVLVGRLWRGLQARMGKEV